MKKKDILRIKALLYEASAKTQAAIRVANEILEEINK
jgi:hypothetical protein